MEILAQWFTFGAGAAVWLMAAIVFNWAKQGDWFLERLESFPAKWRRPALEFSLLVAFLLGPISFASMAIKTFIAWRKGKGSG